MEEYQALTLKMWFRLPREVPFRNTEYVFHVAEHRSAGQHDAYLLH